MTTPLATELQESLTAARETGSPLSDWVVNRLADLQCENNTLREQVRLLQVATENNDRQSVHAIQQCKQIFGVRVLEGEAIRDRLSRLEEDQAQGDDLTDRVAVLEDAVFAGERAFDSGTNRLELESHSERLAELESSIKDLSGLVQIMREALHPAMEFAKALVGGKGCCGGCDDSR